MQKEKREKKIAAELKSKEKSAPIDGGFKEKLAASNAKIAQMIAEDEAKEEAKKKKKALIPVNPGVLASERGEEAFEQEKNVRLAAEADAAEAAAKKVAAAKALFEQ